MIQTSQEKIEMWYTKNIAPFNFSDKLQLLEFIRRIFLPVKHLVQKLFVVNFAALIRFENM